MDLYDWDDVKSTAGYWRRLNEHELLSDDLFLSENGVVYLVGPDELSLAKDYEWAEYLYCRVSRGGIPID